MHHRFPGARWRHGFRHNVQAVGLPVVEAIVREVAAAAPSERVLRCPYEPEDQANY
jgi:hypothetical protein